MGIFRIVAALFRSIVVDRAELAAENLALRQQLAVLQQKLKRPRLRSRDRIFWALLSRIWANWRPLCSSCNPTPWWDGIGKASNCSGGGSRKEDADAPGSKPRFAS